VIGRNLDILTPRVFVPLFDEGLRYLGAYGGRGSGKSHGYGEMLIERALRQPGLTGRGLNWACVREVQKSLEQSVKRLLENKIIKFGAGRHFHVQKDRIVTPGNGLIIFQGMQNHTAESVKSLEDFDGAWVEEAQTLSQTSLDLLRPTIRKARSQLWFSWNPKKATDPVDALLRGNDPKSRERAECSGKPWSPPPRSRVVRANWSDNPFFSDTTLIEEKDYDLARDPDKYAHIWGGDYLRNSEARVFRNWTVDYFETPIDPAPQFYFGADWGMRVDPSVLVRCYIVGRKLFVDYEAWAVGCPLDRRPALFDKVPGARKQIITADGSWPDTLDVMRNSFPKMRAAVKGQGSVAEGVEFLQGYDIVVHPRCQHVIDELTLYSFKVDPRTDEITSVIDDKKNHTIDSLRYALESVRRASRSSSEELRI
jgi:phage terminase large subunit